ncbi:MAG TPA: mechanosensitive ion channel family protein [Acidimicrobiales bacterium]|jgi:small conductance mechanosensitive channel|nr:mechanosensitive ion channel family protein [Acidimicrobiales bacterium]
MTPAFTILAAAGDEGADEVLADALEGLDAGDWITAGIILLGSVVLSRLVQQVAARLIQRGDGAGGDASRFVGRVLAALVVVAGFVYALQVLGVGISPVLGALGIGGLALAFAAQTILENVFASVLLQSRRPFRVGDQICTNDIEGTVEDVNFRTVVLRTYDGEKVLVPCSQVLNAPIVNFTAKGTRRTTLPVGVAYDTDLALAQRLLLEAAASVDGVRPEPKVEAWAEAFGESSIDFALRYWHAPDIATLWQVRSGVALAVKAAFDDAGITIPFPQRTLGFLPEAEVGVRPPGAAGGGGAGDDGGGDGGGGAPAGAR